MTNDDTNKEEKGMGIKNEADPFYDGCPCDFHSEQLTNEETRIALFRPMDDGSKPSALVMVERFWHMQDAHYRALNQKLKEGLEMALRCKPPRKDICGSSKCDCCQRNAGYHEALNDFSTAIKEEIDKLTQPKE